MTVKKSTLALATALAACFVGCEWTGSDESDSWSSAYDAMNFSGTYRAVTTATQLSDTKTETEEVTDKSFATIQESGKTFVKGGKVFSGKTAYANVVPGSFQASSSAGYVWNDNGSGGLVFTDPNSGVSTATEDDDSVEHVVKDETVGTYPGTQPYPLKGNNVVPGSLQISVGTFSFVDDGANHLTQLGVANPTAEGSVDYEAGSVQFSFSGMAPDNVAIKASYKWIEKKGTKQDTEDLSGSGTILYQSGAWSLQINPAMPSDQVITIRYSYYIQNSQSSATYTTINTNTGNEVSALTVSQNGQNLTITLNNGIVMTGKFTNVQQTGKVNQDTNAGYNTYNAQFQVQCDGNRMVGSLNYDLQNGYRMLNGTWTWGKSSYDVQAVGPAWLNSADQSTLSPGVITQ